MNKIEIHKTLCDQLNDIYSRKNADYGDSFAKVRKEVPNAILVRLMDKMERIKRFYSMANASKSLTKKSTIRYSISRITALWKSSSDVTIKRRRHEIPSRSS